MTAAEVVAEHLREDRFYLASLTRERLRRGPYVMEIQAVRYLRRVRAALALQSVRIDAMQAETGRVLGMLDARAAALAREGVLR